MFFRIRATNVRPVSTRWLLYTIYARRQTLTTANDQSGMYIVIGTVNNNSTRKSKRPLRARAQKSVKSLGVLTRDEPLKVASLAARCPSSARLIALSKHPLSAMLCFHFGEVIACFRRFIVRLIKQDVRDGYVALFLSPSRARAEGNIFICAMRIYRGARFSSLSDSLLHHRVCDTRRMGRYLKK